jgi:putative phosphoesterase
MKLAVVADVHGNLAALEAVVADLDRQRPDLVVHGGDLVLNGPKPAEVVDLVRELRWPGIMGNTDQALWELPGWLQDKGRELFSRTTAMTREMIGPARLAWLHELPLEWRDDDMLLVHAAPGDLWKVVKDDAPDDELAGTFGGREARLVVYCHIHRPFVRRMPGLTVANTGSVSIPADGDWRASYLIVEDGRPSLRRVEYDLERELAELRDSRYPSWQALAAMQRTGDFAVARMT